MKFLPNIIFLLISPHLFAQQNHISKQDNDYFVRKGNDTTYCQIKRISHKKIYFIYKGDQKLYNKLSDVIGYKKKDKEFVKVNGSYLKTDSSKHKIKLQKDSSVTFGCSVNAKGNKYILPYNFYRQDYWYENNLSPLTIVFSVGGIFYCKDSIAGGIYLGQNSWYNDEFHDYNFCFNKIGFFGFSAGIRTLLDRYDRKIKSFISFQYDFLAYKINDIETFNVYPANTLTGSAIWKYRNHEIDLGYMASIQALKNIEINLNAGISLNTVIFYNSNNKFPALDNINPKYITNPGIFVIAGIVYNFIEIKKK